MSNVKLTKDQYIEELEKALIFMCDVYSKGADSLGCQTDNDGQANEKWLGIYMSFPTIQGTTNRFAVKRIGNLRTHHLNREAPRISFDELHSLLSFNRKHREQFNG
jgi:hypothetical protein